ncbi:MAG TPA: PRC-barrel domain-containing protein [Burkholderiales bacterium]|nr:PRC-barrel domain-containing protein [Burkholderiales bacterium]
MYKASELDGCTIGATDGDIGNVRDLYFDDQNWAVRYLVVDTGGWLSGRTVLISPISVHAVQATQRRVAVNLTRKQVEDSPDIDTDKPVSRQYEQSYFAYYGYPPYWSGPSLWGAAAYPTAPVPAAIDAPREAVIRMQQEQAAADSHLRSSAEVSGYTIQATDDGIGHVEDFLVDDRDWAIRYIVVDTRNWWPGKKVLISPLWIDRFSWAEKKLYVTVTRDAVKSSPEYDPAMAPSRKYEDALYRHYGRNDVYWLP